MKRLWLPLLVVLLIMGGGVAYLFYQDWRDHSQDTPILAAARRYGVQPALVKAVVWRESRFNPDVHGGKGELGLMQILPRAAAKDWSDAAHVSTLSESQLLNPDTNTLVGAWYLEKLLQRYAHTDNPLPYALADYNAGRGNVLKWEHGNASTNSAAFIEQIGFPSTKRYVRSVIRRYEHYRPIFPPRTN